MMKETKLQKILAFVHLIFILSLVTFTTIAVSLSVLLLPSLCGAFAIGRDLIEGRYNVYDGLLKKFFKELFHYKSALRFFPAQLIWLLQLGSMKAAGVLGGFFFQVILLVIAAFLLTFLLYTCVYLVLLDEKMRVEEIVIRMFKQVGCLISLFSLTVLVLLFANGRMLPAALTAGALLLLAVEACIYHSVHNELDQQKEGENR